MWGEIGRYSEVRMKVPNARRTCLAALAVVRMHTTMASARLAARGLAAAEVVQEHIHLTALLVRVRVRVRVGVGLRVRTRARVKVRVR